MKKMLDKIKRIGISILFPKRCVLCDKLLPLGIGMHKEYICENCIKKLLFIGEKHCAKCGAFLEDDEEMYCINCKSKYIDKKSYYKYGLGILRYNEIVKKSIHRLKYSKRAEYAEFYGQLIAKIHLNEIVKMKLDCFVPVPLHRSRLLNRGYNQAQLIAENISSFLAKKSIDIAVENNLLFRNKKTNVLNKLDSSSRLKALSNAFCANEECDYESICLVDDIYTTGATIEACARELRRVGVKNIYFLAISVIDLN